MKKLLLLCCLIIFINTTIYSQLCKVIGTIDQNSHLCFNEKVYLTKIINAKDVFSNSFDIELIDSSDIDKSGSFELNGLIDSAFLYRITINKRGDRPTNINRQKKNFVFLTLDTDSILVSFNNFLVNTSTKNESKNKELFQFRQFERQAILLYHNLLKLDIDIQTIKSLHEDFTELEIKKLISVNPNTILFPIFMEIRTETLTDFEKGEYILNYIKSNHINSIYAESYKKEYDLPKIILPMPSNK